MHRHLLLICTALFSIFTSTITLAAWAPYPADLPQFDYSGDKLKANWDKLAHAIYLPYPNNKTALDTLAAYPRLKTHFEKLVASGKAHPTIVDAVNGNYEPHLAAVRDVWRLHFEGKFEQAYNKGITLGPLGAMPALQAKLMHTHFLVSDKKQKIKLFEEVNAEAGKYRNIVPDYPFVVFGETYARARLLQLLSTTKAQSTGYIKSSIKTLKSLGKAYPSRGTYSLTHGGLYAGIVEKVGSMLGNVTFGASEKKAIKLLNKGLKNSTKQPVVYYEYAVALASMNQKKHAENIKKLLNTCLTVKPINAEEALNKRACQNMLNRM